MKKILLLLGILFGLPGWPAAWSQVQKGTTYWGGTVAFTGNAERDRETSLNNDTRFKEAQHTISPELQWGKFVNATTMLGLGAKYSLGWNTSTSKPLTAAGEEKGTSQIKQSVGLFPFFRKYKALGERWAVFLHGELGPTHDWSRTNYLGVNSDYGKNREWRYEASLTPGVVYFLPKRHLAIEGYTNVLSLNAGYDKIANGYGRSFRFTTGLTTRFPSYFTLRLAKYLSTTTEQP